MTWSYWHRLEYVRIERGSRVLVHAQDVDDHGFYLDRGGPEGYVQMCAEEFLSRWAEPGTRWRVVLWRLDETGRKKVRRLTEVELHWQDTPLPRQPAEDIPTAQVYERLVSTR